MINRKKNLLVDEGRNWRTSNKSFTSDTKHVLRGRERAMENPRACGRVQEPVVRE